MLNAILRVRHNLIVKQIFSIVKTWKWSKNAGKFHCWYYVQRQTLKKQLQGTGVQILYNIAKCHGCIFYCEILYLFTTYNPALVDSSVFWIFVVIILLNTKSCLIATEQLQISVHFVPKGMNNLLQPSNVFLNCVCSLYTIFWPSYISWCIAKCLIEWWWWYPN